MTRRTLLPASIIALASAAAFATVAATGCSSSSSTGTPENDSGTTTTSDTGTTTQPDSSTTNEGDSSTTTEDTGTTSTSDTGTTMTEAAASCTPASSVTGVPTYTPVTHQSACSAAQVMGFITACDSQGATNATCGAFAMMAANTACMDCIQPYSDAGTLELTGATTEDNMGNLFTNTAACIQITDKSSGTGDCAAAYSELDICFADACQSAACQNDFQTCAMGAATGACMTQYGAYTTACAADRADGGSLTSACTDDTATITVICGNGM
jgi:hypothetical protein